MVHCHMLNRRKKNDLKNNKKHYNSIKQNLALSWVIGITLILMLICPIMTIPQSQSQVHNRTIVNSGEQVRLFPQQSTDGPIILVGKSIWTRASYYSDKFEGRPMAMPGSGTFQQSVATAAMTGLPLGSLIYVHNAVDNLS